jgi:hypothetical protein
LKEVTFEEVYPKAFYEKSEFTYIVIGATVAASAAVTYFTAGAGAPAVAPGAGAIVVSIGGGTQGAYMSGLSTIGSWVGGNAVVGASVVNGLAAGVGVGASSGKLATVGAKLKFAMGITAAAYDGVLIIEKSDTGKLVYIVALNIPKDIGSKTVRVLVNDLYDYEKKIAESESNDFTDLMYKHRDLDLQYGVSLLKEELQANNTSQEDLMVLGIVAYKAGEYDLFKKAIYRLKEKFSDYIEERSFVDYLHAIALLLDYENDDAKLALRASIAAENGVIEPVSLYVALLSEEDFVHNEPVIKQYVSELEMAFDGDDYSTAYSMASVHYRLGTIYLENHDYVLAINHFDKARENLSWIQEWGIMSGFVEQNFKDYIDIGKANALYGNGRSTAAKDLITSVLNRTEEEEKMMTYKTLYEGDV